MLVRAALVPDTALLVPGTAGRADPVPEIAAASRTAVAHLVQARPDVVVVVATAPRCRTDLDRWGPLRPSLAAAGIPDTAWLGQNRWPAAAPYVSDVAAATGLVLLAQAGWSGRTRVLQLRPDGEPDRRRALGADVVTQGRVALLLLGSLSARRGPDAPIAEDPDAATFDDAVLADLGTWDGPARRRLAAVPGAEAGRLAVSAWTAWQVLLGADDGGSVPDVMAAGAPLGATYAVVRWT